MALIERVFLDHPHEQGESYAEHAKVASYYGSRMIVAGLACMVHAVLPGLFCATGSRTIRDLSERMGRRGQVRGVGAARGAATGR